MQTAPLTPDRWDDFVDLFTRKGPRGGSGPVECWCMWWRRRSGSGEANRAAMEELVRAGEEPGLLAYDGGRAVGWISVAPREHYGHLSRSRRYAPPDPHPGVWSIACFQVDPRHRRRGVARALVDAAVAHALARGAAAVEAFPHRGRPDYMGAATMFAAAGFRPVREAGPRTIVRYDAATAPLA
ncbi:MAG: GNAT family N-acetyltransferase [Thermoleophilia bacterium]|nr:GNAT family N-acetyltransferase [Thermoleophilia bacterium]